MSSQGNTAKKSVQCWKWEFYKDTHGLWQWRAIAPEGWQQEQTKGEWSSNQTQQATRASSWSKDGGKTTKWNQPTATEWVEVARSSKGWSSKSECEANAREHGWG